MVHGFTSSYRIKKSDIYIWRGHDINMIDDPLGCHKDVIQINNATKYMKVLNVIIQ